MGDLSKTIGMRIRNRRLRLGISQEQLAERCNLHATYIGQVERGEKNPTIESLEKISGGLGIPLEVLFEKLGAGRKAETPASQAYRLVDSLGEREQRLMLSLIQTALKLRERTE